ncbi:MAG: hypothetical protein H0U57_05800 [Tatlockia sp.]|nr:hypothetical protein [Tatlockia sp.]
MNAFEETAVSTFLSYWPDEIEYSTLISRLASEELGEEEEDFIAIWQPFEYYPGEFIAECIETLHHRLVTTFQANV